MSDLAKLEAAAALVHRVVPPTPQYCWPLLGERVGTEVWVKHENHTPIGAFKLRGGLVYLDDLRRAEPGVRGVITATRGNHGQSIAYAAARLGLAPTIVVPHGNSSEKNLAMRAFGARRSRRATISRPPTNTRSASLRGTRCISCAHTTRCWCAASPPMRWSCFVALPISPRYLCRSGWAAASAA